MKLCCTNGCCQCFKDAKRYMFKTKTRTLISISIFVIVMIVLFLVGFITMFNGVENYNNNVYYLGLIIILVSVGLSLVALLLYIIIQCKYVYNDNNQSTNNDIKDAFDTTTITSDESEDGEDNEDTNEFSD